MGHLPLPLAAFLAGIISFLSPCVLPLVPGYVSHISGATIDQLEHQKDVRLLANVMLKSLMFVLGFSVVFITLGAAATGLGQFTHQYKSILNAIAGVIVIIFGLHLTGLVPIKLFYADTRLHGIKGSSSLFGSFLVGFAFAFGWTPCIGPILTVILKFAYDQNTVGQGILLLAIYSAGLAVPFLLTSLGIERFLKFYSRFSRHLHTVEVVSGGLMIVIGLLIVLNKFTWLSAQLGFLNKFQDFM